MLGACGGRSESATDGGAPDAAPGEGEEECSIIEEGENENFTIGDEDRDFTLVVPDDYDDAKPWPLVFVWHPLFDDDASTIEGTGLGDLAEQQGFFLFAVESRHIEFEWDYFDPTADDNPDVEAFDRLLECSRQIFRIDEDRVYSAGFSAGALMTAYLGMNRADVLAGNAVVSGGLLIPWMASEQTPPWAVIWGGASDTYGGLEFEQTSLALVDDLVGSGHDVVSCDHGLGHDWPPGAEDYIWQFFADHARGEADVYGGTLPAGFPAYCELSE